MVKILWVDCKTNGYIPKCHSIVQLSVIVDIGGKIVDKSCWKMRPQENQTYVDTYALTNNGFTEEQTHSHPFSQKEALESFVSLLDKHSDKFNKEDKFFIAGYYSHHHSDFLRQWFYINENKFFGSYFWTNWMDVACIATEFTKSAREKLPDFKLKTLTDLMQVDSSGATTEMSDIVSVRNLYYKMIGE